MKRILLLAAALVAAAALQAQNYVSKVWVADQGNGTYKNPILYADYSDPDVCRAGDDYYMTASSFVCSPGLPILHSKDMVNWTLINYALPKVPNANLANGAPAHGNAVWAPAIRFHNGEFYIYYGDPDYGIYMVKTKDPAGVWNEPVLVQAGKGWIDTAPLWDDDGNAYIVHGIAGSRAGNNSMLGIVRMTSDGTKTIGETRFIYDGHGTNPTIEGPKFYKRNGYYYIFAPAGGVKPGWQLVLRSKNIWGPYEERKVLAQGSTPVNGPHQGAWVDTPMGEDWFFHFQDLYNYGRVVHLQPMRWVDDWPVMGINQDANGCGEPVLTYKKPNVGKTYPIATPVESDEFDGRTMGLQWQWNANGPVLPVWAYFAGERSMLRLFAAAQPQGYKNLNDSPNLYLQKFPAPVFSAVTKIDAELRQGERAGLLVMGQDYAMISIEPSAGGLTLTQNECLGASDGKAETVNATVNVTGKTVYLKVVVKEKGVCSFSYSSDGKKFTPFGKEFTAKEGRWIGAKVGLFANRSAAGSGGWVDVDYFRIEK